MGCVILTAREPGVVTVWRPIDGGYPYLDRAGSHPRALPAGKCSGRVEDGQNRPIRREPALRTGIGQVRIAVEEANADGQYLVETAVAQFELLEVGEKELRLAGGDMGGIASRRGFDHLARAVDGRQPAALEALADEARGDAVAATDLQDPITGADAELVDDGAEAFAHAGGRASGRAG